jgi:hypothetical protein
MKDDIRKKTCIIIRKNGEYLVGKILWSNDLRWSIYQTDAWRTRDMEKARAMARRTGGIMVLFNPIVNQKRMIGA